MYTNIPKPTGTGYTNTPKPVGTNYINVSKPSNSIYTNISKPSNSTYTNITKPIDGTGGLGFVKGMTMGLMIPLTAAFNNVSVNSWTKITKPI